MKKLYLLFILFAFSGTLSARGFSVNGPLQYEFYASPGEVLEGEINLRANSKLAESISIRCFDFPLEIQTDIDHPIIGQDLHSCAPWMQLSKKELILSPKTDYSYKYHIVVPKDTKLDGTYHCLMLLRPAKSTPYGNSKKSMVSYIMQYAIQVIVHIKDTGKYDMKVVSKKLSQVKNQNTPVYQIKVKNTGTLALRPRVSASIFNQTGAKILNEKLFDRWIYPGKEKTYDVNISELSEGNYKGVVVFDQKGSRYFTTKLNFNIQKDLQEN